jgi:hypothetical protein
MGFLQPYSLATKKEVDGEHIFCVLRQNNPVTASHVLVPHEQSIELAERPLVIGQKRTVEQLFADASQ